jgi:MFS family permease
VLLAGTAAGAVVLALLGLADRFALALALLVLWGVAAAAVTPVRQAYLNDLVPSAQRATVLSFDSLVGSAGGVVVQPALGRAADAWGYGTSYLVGAVINLGALPFLVASRRRRSAADVGGG